MVVEEDLQPAGAGGDELSRVAGAPALSKADAHTVGVVGSVQELSVRAVPQEVRALIVKHLDGVSWHHLPHHQSPAVRHVQGRGVDEYGVLTAVIRPNAVRLFAEEDAIADFSSCALNGAAAVLQVELAQAEARALR